MIKSLKEIAFTAISSNNLQAIEEAEYRINRYVDIYLYDGTELDSVINALEQARITILRNAVTVRTVRNITI